MEEKIIIEDSVLIFDADLFGDRNEHAYDCRCHDGFAVCMSAEEDAKAPEVILVKYPKLSELDDIAKEEILDYRGISHPNLDDITYGDVMIACGVVKKDISRELEKEMKKLLSINQQKTRL